MAPHRGDVPPRAQATRPRPGREAEWPFLPPHGSMPCQQCVRCVRQTHPAQAGEAGSAEVRLPQKRCDEGGRAKSKQPLRRGSLMPASRQSRACEQLGLRKKAAGESGPLHNQLSAEALSLAAALVQGAFVRRHQTRRCSPLPARAPAYSLAMNLKAGPLSGGQSRNAGVAAGASAAVDRGRAPAHSAQLLPGCDRVAKSRQRCGLPQAPRPRQGRGCALLRRRSTQRGRGRGEVAAGACLETVSTSARQPPSRLTPREDLLGTGGAHAEAEAGGPAALRGGAKRRMAMP